MMMLACLSGLVFWTAGVRAQLARCTVAQACRADPVEISAARQGVRVATDGEIDAMRKFAELVERSCRHKYGASSFNKLARHVEVIEQWRALHLTQVPKRLSGVYLFSGMDLATLVGFQPLGKSYTLLAEFKPGDWACLLQPECSARALDSAVSWYGHVLARDFLFSVTVEMRAFFAKVGVLPAILLNAQLLGHEVVGATWTSSSVSLRTQRWSSSSVWTCSRLTYIGGRMVKERADLDTMTLHADMPFLTVFKAGPHEVMRQPWFAKTIASASAVILQDESGPQPNVLAALGMHVRSFGHFANFTQDQKEKYRRNGDAASIERAYERASRVEPLPFCFGYCEGNGEGTLLVSHAPLYAPSGPRLEPRLWLVLAQQRSGSSWLTSLLGSHPRVKFDHKQESLIGWTAHRRVRDKTSDWSPEAFRRALDDVWASLTRDADANTYVVGFKLMWDQVAYPEVAADWLRKKQASYVHIERQSPLLQLASSHQASATSTYHVHSKKQSHVGFPPVRLDPTSVAAFIKAASHSHASMRAWADTWADNGRALFYEDLVQHTEPTLAELFHAMGIDPDEPRIEQNHGMENFYQINNNSCSSRITNLDTVLAKLHPIVASCQCREW